MDSLISRVYIFHIGIFSLSCIVLVYDPYTYTESSSFLQPMAMQLPTGEPLSVIFLDTEGLF